MKLAGLHPDEQRRLQSLRSSGLLNSGKITGTNGDGISLSDGNTKIINTGTLEGTQYGINGLC